MSLACINLYIQLHNTQSVRISKSVSKINDEQSQIGHSATVSSTLTMLAHTVTQRTAGCRASRRLVNKQATLRASEAPQNDAAPPSDVIRAF